MAKHPSIPEELRQMAVTAVAAAWDDGCPIADYRPERRAQLADVCLRRWRSFRRRGISPSDRPEQVKDVARGLVEASEETRGSVGPLILDFQYLAERVLTAIDEWKSEHGDPGVSERPSD